MQYIDIDGDPSTFSSSSATLSVPDPDCSQIRYAALYWGAVYPPGDRTDDGNPSLDQVKFRMPGGSYMDITADEVLFNGAGDGNFGYYAPYAAYKDVTSLVAGLADPDGEYTLANIRAGSGSSVSGGVSGGWMMVVVYENPTLPGKFITTFDGYAGIASGQNLEFPVDGFTTLPNPFPVRAKLGVATLEGDRNISGDGLSIRADSNGSFTSLGNTVNPSTNFFNSNITFEENTITSRNPNSPNTLGWDVDMFTINNPNNNVIPNGETGATFRATSSQDKYDIFFASMDVEVIEPQINLAKTVEDIGGNDITGQGVNLGQELDYVLTFQNVGNDDAVGYTIRDVLPVNVTLNESNIIMPAGVTYTYDPGTRTVTFSIPDHLVEEDDPFARIRMRVRVAENCYDFIDACTDIIQNLAYSTYRGGINPNQITDDPSVYDFDGCGFPSPGATNFLLDDLSACNFDRTVQLCGDDVLLDAGDNFDNYIWYRDENGNGQIDLGVDTVINDGNPDGDPSTMLVTEPGTYIVDKQVADPCKDFQEIITVEQFGSVQSNPISVMINNPNSGIEGEILVCPNDGSELPEIFLCGLNDSELLQVNIPDALSIVWEKLDEDSCGAATEDCANTNTACTWNTVHTGNDFTAEDSGEYRLLINYQDGCFSRFFFNVYKNPLDPQYTSSDIICDTPGNITVTNMPANYLFQLVEQTSGNVVFPYQSSPSFDIVNNGGYRVEMIQDGVDDGCVFVLENIGILNRNFEVEISSKDSDCSGLGEISISVNNVEPQYHYTISQGGTVVDTFSPSVDNNYTFEGLNPGTYDVSVTTDDGCEYTEQVSIVDRTDLAVTALTTKNIDCAEGVITVTGTGGFPDPHYSYAIWSYNGVDLYTDISEIPAEAFQSNSAFTFTNGQEGTYEFVALDGNNCPVFSNEAFIEVTPAVEYTTSLSDESCFGAEDGSFTITVTQSNGYSLGFVLTHPDGSTTINASGSFTNLERGDYTLTVSQYDGVNSCDFIETFTIGGPDELVADMDPVLVQDYTCLQDAIIGVQNVSGGTAPYQYSIDGVNFIPDSGTLGEEFFSNLTAGTYTITVRDANDCVLAINPITIAPLDPPTDISFAATDPLCPDFESDVTLTVTGGTPDLVYEIIAPAGSVGNNGNNNVFTGLAPDTYLFRVTDSNGCSYEESYTIDAPSVISVTGQAMGDIGCFGASDGTASFTVTNFNTDFDYSITGPASFAETSQTNGSISLNGLAAGTYTITVTDNLTGCEDTAQVIIDAPAATLEATHVLSQPTCVADGSVQITATGGWGSYTYEITAGPSGYTLPLSNGNGQFTALDLEGTYTYTVTDSSGCEFTDDFEIVAAEPPVLDITANDICYDDAVGLTLTASVTSGGDGNYEYSLNGGAFQSSADFSGYGPGTYTIEVRDGNDCTDQATITIDPELSLVASAPNITSCGTDTDISFSATGGDGNYVYAVVPNGTTPTSFDTTNPVTVTASGNYTVYVRDNGGAAGYCEASYALEIDQDPPLTLGVSTTNNLCSGDAQGQIIATGSGGEAPYTYSINGGTFSPNNTFNNLAAGSYAIRVRDANGCVVMQQATITEPYTLSASAAVTALAECFPGLGAEVRITNAIGGTPGYEYSFDGGTSYGPSPIGHLLPGTHTVSIRDANDCTHFMSVTVEPEPTQPTVTTDIDYDCEGDGIITLTGSSADFDYTYLLDGVPNDPVDSNVFNGLSPGNHTITVNYTSNTPPSRSILLTEDFGTGANTSIPEVDPLYCYEPQNGDPNSCGHQPVNPQLNDGEYVVTQEIASPFGTWQSPNDHSGLTNGRFLAMNVGGAVGANGIIYAKRDIEVIPNREITISLQVFNLLKVGESGADPNIEIQLVDGGGAVIATTTTGEIPKNQNADDWQEYTVTLNPGANTNLDIVIRTHSAVTGGNDLAMDDIQAFQIPEVCPVSFDIPVYIEDGHGFDAALAGHTNISCFNGTDGTISFEVENFDPIIGFTYEIGGSLSGAQTNGSITLSGLAAGTHEITIVDLRNPACSVVLTQTLTQPDAVEVTATITELTCTNGGGTLTASATGGTPAYEYQLEETDGTPIVLFQSSPVFSGLAAGEYIIRARDNNLCEEVTSVLTIEDPEPLEFNLVPTACYGGGNDGTIQVNVTDGNENYRFRMGTTGPWITPTPSTSLTHTFGNLTAGTYTIQVMDGYGCVEQDTVTIVDALNASVEVVDISSCAEGSITVTASGGSPTLEYAFMPAGTPPADVDFSSSNVYTVAIGGEGDYDVYVRDNSAEDPYCEFKETVTVNPATPLTMDVTPTDPDCHDGTGSILVEITSGIAPYTIQIVDVNNGGASDRTDTNVLSLSRTYYNLTPGNYTINVTDATGCTVTDSQAIVNPDELTGIVSGETPLACTGDINDFGFDFSGYPTTLGIIQFSDDGGATWPSGKDSSDPGVSDQFRGYVSGETVYPSMRIVDGTGNTLCQTDLPPFIIPYPLDDLDISIDAVVVDCNELQVTVQGSQGTPGYHYTYSDDPTNFDPNLATWIPGGDQLPDGTPVDPGDGMYVWENLVPGRTYVFYVRDNEGAGCIRQSSINVNDLIDVPVEITSVVTPTCAGESTGSITYTVIDNDAPFETQLRWAFYDMSTGVPVEVANSGATPVSFTSPQQDVSFIGLPSGNYYLEVTMVDDFGVDSCVGATENILLEELDPLSGTLVVLQDISCAEPGLIQVQSPFGGGGTYTYTVTGPVGFTTITTTGDNPIEIPANSPAGTYAVEMFDQYSCAMPLGTVDLTLTPNPTIDTISVENCDAPITVNISASNTSGAQIFYSMDGGATYLNNGGVFNNVAPGTYDVYIRDSNGCIDTETITISAPMEFTAIQTVALDCEPDTAANAEIEISVIAGSGNYQYSIDGPGSVDQIRINLPSPTYTWNGASVPGDYVITVYDMGTDSPHCERTITVNVPDRVMPEISVSSFTDVSCSGADDGSISVSAVDLGTGPYTFEIISDSEGGTSFPIAPTSSNNLSATFTNLMGSVTGITYTIEVTAANGCSDTLTQLIREPEPVAISSVDVVEFLCAVGNNMDFASITVDPANVSGGSGTYVRYEFIKDGVSVQDGSNNVYVETDILGGSYIVNVYDTNGCVGTTTADIAPFDVITDIDADITTQLSCAPGVDGEITITVTSSEGSLPGDFEYSIDNGVTWEVSNVFGGLGAGTYNFLARHLVTGCIAATSETILDPNTFTIDLTVDNNAVCYDTASGAVTFELIDATYANGFNWTIYDTNGTLTDSSDDTAVANGNSLTTGPVTYTGLEAGSYRLVITQDQFPGCENEEAFTITAPAAELTASVEVTDISCVPGEDGVIEILAQGGWGGYRYFVAPTTDPAPVDANYGPSARFEGLEVGTYQIWVIDQFGCALQLPNETLAEPDPIIATLQINDDNCAAFEGEIEVVGIPDTDPIIGGQGSNYTYQLIKDGSNVGSPQTSTVFSGLGAGSYEVYILDQWGCDLLVGPVDLYDVMTAITTVVDPIGCGPLNANEGGAITVTVTGGSGDFEYVALYPDGSTVTNDTGVFTDLDLAGLYTFTITDTETTSSDCEITITQSLDAPVIPVIEDVTVVDVSCHGGSDGVLTVVMDPTTVVDRVLTYVLYEITDLVNPYRHAQSIGTFDMLPLGAYQVQVISSRGCVDTFDVTVAEPTELLATAQVSPFVCAADNTVNESTITVTVPFGAGTAPYRYSFDGGGFTSNESYKVFDTGSTQNIPYIVRDANGCEFTGSVEVLPLNTFEVNLGLDTAISCGGPEVVTLNVVNELLGGDSYTFELLPVGNTNGSVVSTTSISASFELFNPGTYTFRVTNDTTGCYELVSHEILPYDLIEVEAVATAPAICFDDAGTLEFTVSGNAGAYSYEVFRTDGTLIGGSTGSGTGTLSFTHVDLIGGNYFVRVTQTDLPECAEDSNVVTILSPPAPLMVAPVEVATVTCMDNLGEILVSPTGGYAPYDIELFLNTTLVETVENVSSHLFGGLASGDYQVRVVDAGGCEIVSNITLELPDPILTDINVSPSDLQCFGDTDGSVWADLPTGGSGSYLYRLNVYDASGTTIVSTSGAQSSPTFNGLGAGTYSITVSDGWGCDVQTALVTISEPVEVLASLVQVTAMSCTDDAEIRLTASGGTAPYTYSVDGLSYLPMSGGNTHSFDVMEGAYQYYVRDANGCDANISNLVTIDPVPPLVLTIDESAAMINCMGEATASLRATAVGGLGNYSYELYGDALFTDLLVGPQPGGTFSALTAGEYYIRVTSGDCVEESAAIIIEDPLPLQVDVEESTDVSCYGLSDGSIRVEVSGGTGEILYAVSPNLNQFDTRNTFTGLAAGIYDVVAQDVNGCFITFQFEIEQPDVLSASAENILHEVCHDSADGSFEIQVSGGTAPYSTALDSNADSDFVPGQFVFTNLSAGTHVVFVRDAEGCETNLFVEIEPGVNLAATVTPVYECTGNVPDNYLEVFFEDPSVVSEVMYALDSTDPNDFQLEADFANMSPGEHTLSVLHSNGCMVSYTFTIEDYEPLMLVLENNMINQISAVATGGLEDYTFYFEGVDHGSDTTFFITRTDTYTVRVVDQNGCEVIAQIYVEFIDLEMPNFFTPDGDGRNDTWVPKNIDGFPEVLIRIYDRYGRVVEQMTRDTQGWDGNYDGKPLPTGDYWYIVQINGENDDREWVGHFTLYRQ